MARHRRASVGVGEGGFLRSVVLRRDEVPSFERYPFSIPALRGLEQLELDPRVTVLVGENGSGKSTLIEAIAIAAGFNPEGGTKNFRLETRRTESELHRALRLVRGHRRERDGFFLRAETTFNLATYVEQIDVLRSYGGRSLHEQSHGESFLALAQNRWGADSLYILDEPEAALSPARQLTLLAILHDLVSARGCQVLAATHSPILMAYPGARIYALGPDGIRPVEYEQTEHYQITRDFLADRQRFFKHLFRDGGPQDA